MTNDPISAAMTGAASANTTATKKSDDALGRDAFLNLLVTQLQHQNPLEPQPDGEFLAQLAQFSSLESLKQMQDDIGALRTMFESVGSRVVADTDTTTTGGA